MSLEGFTLGVEEEYQLVEPSSRELRSRADVVRRADRSGAVEGEVLDTMVEIGTPVCRDSAEVAARLRERRFQASAAAAAEDLEIVAAGVHPFSLSQHHRLTDADRPRMLMGLFRQLLRQQHIWGLHIHVAIPESLDRAVLMNTVRAYSPHLLALSCSSPMTLGHDTGFASYRAVAWRAYPFSGVPPRFDSADAYRAYLDAIVRSGIILDERTVYWSVRPSSRYPTLELRMCDACPRLADAVAIAGLGRAIVVGAAEGLLGAAGSSLSAALQDELLDANEWIASRDGLDAMLMAPELEAGRVPMREAIPALLDRLRPILDALGDTEVIGGVERILESGNAATRIRERQAERNDPREVVDWLISETRVGTGIDRRAEGRDVGVTSGTEEVA